MRTSRDRGRRDEPRAPIGWIEGYLEMGRESVLSVLAARGLRPSPAEIRQITAIINPGLLFQLLQSAAIATTKSEALAPLRRPAGMRADSGSRSIARSRGRRAASTGKKADSHVR